MSDTLIKRAFAEIENPTFEITKQYLDVNNIEFEYGKPKIELIDMDSFQEVNIIYIRVIDEPFFIFFKFSKENSELLWVDIANANQIYFTVTSKDLTFEELSKMTKLKELKGWSYNEMRPYGKKLYGFSRISYEPIKNRAFDFEIKLKRLLSDLENDTEGVRTLVERANAIISVNHEMYISGNKGIHFDRETLHRLSKLKLGIDIDQYVYGNEIY